MRYFHSLINLIDTLHSEDDCRLYLESAKWGRDPICPHCGSVDAHHYRLRTAGVFRGLYKCRDCRSRFTVTVGTMFESSHIPLKKWFVAIYLFLSHKKGVSSMQLHKDLGVTQKTAWFMLNRIRVNFRDLIEVEFQSETQIDETYVGGKNRGRQSSTQGRNTKTKVPVMGLYSEGKVYIKVIPNASGDTLKRVIYRLVRQGSTIVTDGWVGYSGLTRDFIHKVVPHSRGIYVKDGYHTNAIEGFWSHLKRGIIGVYHFVSSKHLPKYCEEFAYRYNTRQLTDGERFGQFLSVANTKMEYLDLTSYHYFW